jgi:hypothetical protein
MGGVDRGVEEALESDARQERMDRVAVLFGEITAATREFLRALAESDRHRDWAVEGFGSCAEWLSWRIGITKNTANEKVRAARALEELPLISDAMARGVISFSKVRALTRAATPANEAELLAYAKAGSTASLERLVRGWKTLGRLDEARAERLRHRLRSFSVFPDGEGMYVVRGVLEPEVAAALMRAVEAASDALYVGRAAAGGASGGGVDTGVHGDDECLEPEQLRADALGLVAERALAAGFGGRGGPSGREDARVGSGNGKDSLDGDEHGGDEHGGDEHGGGDAPISGARAERYQVMLHVEPETLGAEGEPGKSELDDGTRVTAETARRLACDASLATVVRGPDGSVVAAGRRMRTIPPALRRALEARDRGCRFPGCGLRFTDGHHIEHWADGGETTLRNTVLLCRRHHRRVHEDGYRVFSDTEGRVVFFTPRGRAIAAAPPMPELTAALAGLARPADTDGVPGTQPALAAADELVGSAAAAQELTGPAAAAAELTGPAAAPQELTGPATAVVRRNRERGVRPDWRSGLPAYRHDRDVPWEIELAALEALDPIDDNEPSAEAA